VDVDELPLELNPSEVKELIDRKQAVRLIDVREPEEYALARIEGSELIPMGTVPANLQKLEDSDGALIVICHHGVRSLQVAAWLRGHGVENAQSMSGGIDAWSRFIDPAVGRY
jgi:rhodanese-related sulfurtransferase